MSYNVSTKKLSALFNEQDILLDNTARDKINLALQRQNLFEDKTLTVEDNFIRKVAYEISNPSAKKVVINIGFPENNDTPTIFKNMEVLTAAILKQEKTIDIEVMGSPKAIKSLLGIKEDIIQYMEFSEPEIEMLQWDNITVPTKNAWANKDFILNKIDNATEEIQELLNVDAAIWEDTEFVDKIIQKIINKEFLGTIGDKTIIVPEEIFNKPIFSQVLINNIKAKDIYNGRKDIKKFSSYIEKIENMPEENKKLITENLQDKSFLLKIFTSGKERNWDNDFLLNIMSIIPKEFFSDIEVVNKIVENTIDNRHHVSNHEKSQKIISQLSPDTLMDKEVLRTIVAHEKESFLYHVSPTLFSRMENICWVLDEYLKQDKYMKTEVSKKIKENVNMLVKSAVVDDLIDNINNYQYKDQRTKKEIYDILLNSNEFLDKMSSDDKLIEKMIINYPKSFKYLNEKKQEKHVDIFVENYTGTTSLGALAFKLKKTDNIEKALQDDYRIFFDKKCPEEWKTNPNYIQAVINHQYMTEKILKKSWLAVEPHLEEILKNHQHVWNILPAEYKEKTSIIKAYLSNSESNLNKIDNKAWSQKAVCLTAIAQATHQNADKIMNKVSPLFFNEKDFFYSFLEVLDEKTKHDKETNAKLINHLPQKIKQILNNLENTDSGYQNSFKSYLLADKLNQTLKKNKSTTMKLSKI